MKIKRSHVYSANLNPRFGSEAGKIRPVLVLQTDVMNGRHPSTIVCPFTSKVNPAVEIMRVHFKKGEAGLKSDSDLMIDQLRAIDNQRFHEELGKASPKRMKEVREKIELVLGF